MLLLWWLASFGGRHAEFFGAAGLIDAAALRESATLARGLADEMPELNAGLPDPAGEGVRVRLPRWSPMFWADQPWKVHALLGITLLAAAGLIAGKFLRVAAPVGWLGACAFATQPVSAAGGAESFALLAGFGTMLGCLLADRRGGGSGPRFALRLWQLHAAAWIVAAGLAKVQHGDWWQGIALWQAQRPPGSWTVAGIQALRENPEGLKWELAVWSFAARALIVWQVWFPAFAWTKPGRWAVLAGGIVALIGSGALFGDPLFGPAWLATCLAFLREGDWRRAFRRPPGS